MRVSRLICALGAVLFCLGPRPLPAAIIRCTGTNGSPYFTDRECPEGFGREGEVNTLSGGAGSSREPYVCRFAAILSSFEIDGALNDGRTGLREAEARSDEAGREFWKKCLRRLEARKEVLAGEHAPPGGSPAEPGAAEPPVDTVCRQGSFETRSDGGLTFQVSFASRSGVPCESIEYVCTYELIVLGPVLGTYTESRYLTYRGRVEPGRVRRLGSVTPKSGPPNRRLGWIRCRFR